LSGPANRDWRALEELEMVLLKSDSDEEGRLLAEAKRNVDQRWRRRSLWWRLTPLFGMLAVLWGFGVIVLLSGQHNPLLVAGVLAMVTVQAMTKTVILLRTDPERLYDDMRILFVPWVAMMVLLQQMRY
jgi:hypothetical protein